MMGSLGIKPFAGLLLRCPRCSADALLQDVGVVCSSCDAVFPDRQGSLDFMGPYSQGADLVNAKAVADHVQRVLNLPASASEAVAAAMAASSERTGTSYIDAEIAALPSRFGYEDVGGAGQVGADGGGPHAAPHAASGQCLTFIGHHAPPTAGCSETIYRSVRFRAEQFLYAEGPARIALTYAWRPAGFRALVHWLARLRRPEGAGAVPTPLPIDLPAGRELTLPVKIRTPDQPGLYTLLIQPVEAGMEASGGPRLRIMMEIFATDNGPAPTTRGDAVERGIGIPDYGDDHAAGIACMRAYMNRKYSSGYVLLEIASGVNPHAVPFAGAGTVIASDVCSNQMQLGAIYARHHFPPALAANIGFASFDAFNAPFQPGQFDGVVMFSALHHFPDPVALLAKLASLIRPDGFVAVLSEPCDPSVSSEPYVRDLLQGINEQIFSVEEYLHVFRLAGLVPVMARDDGGSFKAILERKA